MIVQSPTPTCWAHEKVEFRIEDRDVSGVKLQQTGYKVTVDTKYPAQLVSISRHNDMEGNFTF